MLVIALLAGGRLGKGNGILEYYGTEARLNSFIDVLISRNFYT